MKRYAIYKHIGRFLSVIIAVLCILFLGVQGTCSTAFADEGYSFDSVNVIEDLASSTVNGLPFDFSLYPRNSNDDVKVINFVEYCYSYRANKNDNYGLYIYVYNPKGTAFVTTGRQNKIQMAVEYNDSGEPTRYEKFNLQFCSKSSGSNYDYLFYKFKVVDKKINGKYFYERVSQDSRRYDVSGIELLNSGQQNATEYTVGGTYIFTGYAQGYGPVTSAESTLSCTCEYLESLRLDVHHTHYRTNSSSLGKDHYNEVNTVYFSIPDRVFRNYGYLQKIRAEWWEYKTQLAVVTSNRDAYNSLLPYVGTYVDRYNSSIPLGLYTDLKASSDGNITVYRYGWTYNVDLATQYNFFSIPTQMSFSDSITHIIPYVFYSPAVDVDRVFKFLYSKPIAGDVSSNEVAEWIYAYSNDLGNGYVDCNGRPISKDLFIDTVDEGRTRGHNDVTIDLSDTFDLNSYDSNHSWWDKLCDFGFSWSQTSGDYSNVSPIYELQSSDLVGTNESIADALLIDSDDVSDLKTYYAAETLKGNHVILFRFATTDYYCRGVQRTNASISASPDVYVAQETVFLDFDIIELTFNKDGEYHVIPVVSSPTDIINGFTQPKNTFEWWKILASVIVLILLVLLLWPVLPYIIQAVIWLITLPYKIIRNAIDRHRIKKIEKATRKEK